MEECRTKNLMRTGISIAIAILTAGVFTGMLMERSVWKVEAKMAVTQQKLAEEVLRFHVLANSDSEEDQALKMKVKEAVLSYMKEEFPDAKSADETKNWVRNHETDFEKVAEKVIRNEGYHYPVKVELTTSYFPDKTYGDVTFPRGNYEALRIEIGKAKGQNWWCLLFPGLCFAGTVEGEVPPPQKEKLRQVLTQEEYEAVTGKENLHFGFKWF